MGSNPCILGGAITAEGQRLLEQGRGFEPEANWLLDSVRVQPGWRAVDAGCGPLGVLDLLAGRVGPAGEVIGMERDSRLIEMGRSILAQRVLGSARFVLGDAYNCGLSRGCFDLIHARLLLINLRDPERALRELIALVRPSAIVAIQDIDEVPWLCEPPHPAWKALISTFLLIWRANGWQGRRSRHLPS